MNLENNKVSGRYMAEDFIQDEVSGRYMAEDFIQDEGEVGCVKEISSDNDFKECDHIDINGPRVIFATIKECKASESPMNVTPTNEWDVSENVLGLFFIVNADESVMDKGVQILTRDNVQIWSSPIKKLPENSIVIDGIEGDIYISAKGMESIKLEDEFNGNYFVTVEDSEVQSMVLKIEGLNDSEDIVEDDYEDENEHDGYDSEEFAQESDCEDTGVLENTDVNELMESTSKTESVDVGKEIMGRTFRFGKFNSECCGEVWSDVLCGIDIVIEKIGEKYIVTLNNIAKKPITLLNGEEPFFVFDGVVETFIEKVKGMVCKSFSISIEEFESMKKAIVVNNGVLDEELDESISVIDRDFVLESVTLNDGELLVDLREDGFYAIYKYESNNIMKFKSCNVADKDLISLYENLSEVTTMIMENNVYLVGLSVVDEISKIYPNIANEYSIKTLSKVYIDSLYAVHAVPDVDIYDDEEDCDDECYENKYEDSQYDKDYYGEVF